MKATVMAIGSWRRRRRLERGFAIGFVLLILSQADGTYGVAGLGALLVSVCLVVVVIEGLRRVGR